MSSDPSAAASLIRPALASDQHAVGITAEACGLFPAELIGELMSGWLGGAAQDLWLVAERSGQIAGLAFAEPERLTAGTWNLRAIGVLEAHRRGGLGAALLGAAETALRERSGRLLIIETSDAADQDAARAFYPARGYKEEARLGDFWEDGVAKVIFTKPLQEIAG